MSTPFDSVVDRIAGERYHNQRRQIHSDLASQGIVRDLEENCGTLRADIDSGQIRTWLNSKTPGARGRKIDLLMGEAAGDGKPDLRKLRICVENKSVWTAHRNVDARYDDLNDALQVIHSVKSEAVLVATVIVGVATRVLNVADQVKKHYRKDTEKFANYVLPRLSSGDLTLWDEFQFAISENDPRDAQKTIEKFRSLPTRPIGQTHVKGYDFVLLVPVFVDNVNPPRIERTNTLGIDVDAEYARMIDRICRAYSVRFKD
jgi:hypothetical protein